MKTFHSDYSHLMLRRDEVYHLLSVAGFPFSPKDDGHGQDSSPSNWKQLYAAKKGLRVLEVAWILEGLEPKNYRPSMVDSAAVVRNEDVVSDLVIAGEIDTFNTSQHDDTRIDTWLLKHDSILEWCERTGYSWPLSQFIRPAETENVAAAASAKHVNQQDQDELNQELVALRQEVADLRTTVEELKRSVPLHPGGNMGKAIEVQHKYWQDPDSNRPKAAVIVAEMRDKYPELSDANANAIEKVACPIDRKR